MTGLIARSAPEQPLEFPAELRRALLAHVVGGTLGTWVARRFPPPVPALVIRRAALAGLGLAYVPEDQIQADVREGRFVRVLDDWCEPFPGYHLYYPSRHLHSAAFAVLVEALRHRDGPEASRRS